MTKKVQLGFENDFVTIPVADILPVRVLSKSIKSSRKYTQITASIREIGLVEPPVVALCVAPFGMEEGTHAELPPHDLGLIVGEPVRFRFFGSSVRRDDAAGAELDDPSELDELSPIEVTLPAEGRTEGDVVPVRLSAQVTAVGTLLLEAVPFEPLNADERWKIELSVRG